MNTQTDISDYQNENAGNGNIAQILAPKMLVHENSPTEYYIGISVNGSNSLAPTWSIRQIIKIGETWATTLYPNGDQNFNYVWDNRLIYEYK